MYQVAETWIIGFLTQKNILIMFYNKLTAVPLFFLICFKSKYDIVKNRRKLLETNTVQLWLIFKIGGVPVKQSYE